MDKALWQRIDGVFNEALALSAEQRTPFLERRCGDDKVMHAWVKAMLEAKSGEVAFLEPPTFNTETPCQGRLPSGHRIGAYALQHRLGRGGMGEVYAASRVDGTFDREVAVKIMQPGLRGIDLMERFHRERHILAGLDHPNIAHLYDGGVTSDGRPYLVMEYVAGEPIDRFCETRALPLPARIRLFQKVCAAVHFAHQNLVIHRDLKPGNILVTAEGQPKLLDFGIAKMLSGQSGDATATGLPRAMTPEYASPEQFRGEAITTASDVYALGILLYQLLTGRKPYALGSGGLAGLLHAVCEVDPVKPSQRVAQTTNAGERLVPGLEDGTAKGLARQLAGDLDNIVSMALAKEPGKRYASAQRLSEDLDRYLTGYAVLAHEDTMVYRMSKFARRNWIPVAASLIALVLLCGLSLALLFQQRDTQRERAHAERQRDIARRERDQSRLVTEFLVDLFQVSDPTRPDGGEVSARALLDRASASIRGGAAMDPLTRAALLQTLGRVYTHMALYAEADPLLGEAVDVLRAQGAGERRHLAKTLAYRGNLLRETGQFGEADRLLEEALSIQMEETPGEASDSPLETLHILIALRQQQGRYREAEPLLARAFRLHEEGRDLALLARCLHLQANNWFRLGLFDRIEPALRRALEIEEQVFGENHARLIGTLNGLGLNHRHRGLLAEAESFYRRAIEIAERHYGPDHYEVGKLLNNLAVLHEKRRDFAAAEALTVRSAAIAEKALGAGHANTIRIRGNLGGLLLARGDTHAAQRVFAETLDDLFGSLGACHPDTAAIMRRLAVTEAALGRDGQAEALYRQALEAYRHGLGEVHPESLAAMYELAIFCRQRDRDAEALDLMRRVVAAGIDGPRLEESAILERIAGFADLLREHGGEGEAAFWESMAADMAESPAP